MLKFQLKQKKTSRQSGLTCYTFSNHIYRAKVFVMPDEQQRQQIQYPVLVEPITVAFTELPQVSILSNINTECSIPFPIDMERLPLFCEKLGALPPMVEDLKQLLEGIEGAEYEP